MGLTTKVCIGCYHYKRYTLHNRGYHAPDKCIWWEAVDGCGNADFHAHTKRDLIKLIDEYEERES